MTLGRTKKNDISIGHKSVSGNHCIFTPGKVEDISNGGTFLHIRSDEAFKHGY